MGDLENRVTFLISEDLFLGSMILEKGLNYKHS